VTAAVFCRFSGIPPNRATSGFLPARSTLASTHVLGPCGVSILAYGGPPSSSPWTSAFETNAADPRHQRIEAATKIWAADVGASPLGRMAAEAAGASVDRAGRVQVNPDCKLSGHSEVFVAHA
jgi:hypothetical protein